MGGLESVASNHADPLIFFWKKKSVQNDGKILALGWQDGFWNGFGWLALRLLTKRARVVSRGCVRGDREAEQGAERRVTFNQNTHCKLKNGSC
jgi:hypothetical protein